jgi:hypothetical protein
MKVLQFFKELHIFAFFFYITWKVAGCSLTEVGNKNTTKEEVRTMTETEKKAIIQRTYGDILTVLCQCEDLPEELKDALKVPPSELDDDTFLKLQEWCADNAMVSSFTGIGIIETAWYGAQRMDFEPVVNRYPGLGGSK